MASVKKRAYLLTFNNPAEHGMTHEAIKEILAQKFTLAITIYLFSLFLEL